MVVDIILPLIISLLPGGLLLLVARIRLDIVEWLFLSSSMSIVILTVVGVATQDVLPLTVTTIGAAYLVFFVILLRTKHHLCPGSSRKIALPEIRATHLLMIIPLALSFMAWRTAYGIASIDMGWHAFWAQQISNTGLLPNYSIIEPFDQASRFVYGPHLLLGTFSILTGRTTDTIFWMPLAIFSTLNIKFPRRLYSARKPVRRPWLLSTTGFDLYPTSPAARLEIHGAGFFSLLYEFRLSSICRNRCVSDSPSPDLGVDMGKKRKSNRCNQNVTLVKTPPSRSTHRSGCYPDYPSSIGFS